MQQKCSVSDPKSSMKNEWAYCDYAFLNFYRTHNLCGKVYVLWVVGLKKTFFSIFHLKIDFYNWKIFSKF